MVVARRDTARTAKEGLAMVDLEQLPCLLGCPAMEGGGVVGFVG